MTSKILFVELFQPFAQYRNPFTFYYTQTFPLPPKTTIIGMLQNACNDWYGNNEGIEKWWDLKVSIHGGFESVFWNYQNFIKGRLSITSGGVWINRHDKNPGGNIWLPLYGESLTSQRSPIYQQELINGHLYIFIKGDQNLIEKIKAALENPTKILYLGRSEDIVFIKKVEEIKPSKLYNVRNDLCLTYPTYIKKENFPIKNKIYPVFSIPINVMFENNRRPVKTKAEITKLTERKPEFETVIYTQYESVIHLNKNDGIKVERYELKDCDGKYLLFKILSDYGWL